MDHLSSIQNISFIGAGNVAFNLASAFQKLHLNIVQVCAGSKESTDEFAKKFKCHAVYQPRSLDPGIDLLVLAVPDAVIMQLSKEIPQTDGIVVHTSGFAAMEALSGHENYGVFYPLQTFSKERIIDFSGIPICLESNTAESDTKLAKIADKLSTKVARVTSEDRRHLHLAAVMANNFTNHFYGMAEDYLKAQNLDFGILGPLIDETARKVQGISPSKAQTGPAKRNDTNTMEKHLDMLKNNPDLRELYQVISNQIRKKYHG